MYQRKGRYFILSIARTGCYHTEPDCRDCPHVPGRGLPPPALLSIAHITVLSVFPRFIISGISLSLFKYRLPRLALRLLTF